MEMSVDQKYDKTFFQTNIFKDFIHYFDLTA